jgi:drug/metabolite transporter (DMT)-like permease
MVLSASVCFGTLAIFGKFAEEAGLNTTTLLTFRFIFGTAFVWLGLALAGRASVLPSDQRRPALGLGFLYAAFTGLFFWGLLFVPAGVAGLAFYTYPVYVYALSVTFLDERLTRFKLLALVFALAGVGLMVGGDAAGIALGADDAPSIDAFGIALILLASTGYAVYITGSRAAVASIEPDILAGTAMVASTVSFLGLGVLTRRLSVPAGSDQWLLVVGIAAIGTAIPIFLYVSGLELIPASHASVLSTAEPLMTVLLGILLLGETLSVPLVVGGMCVIGGVLLVQLDVTSPETKEAADTND